MRLKAQLNHCIYLILHIMYLQYRSFSPSRVLNFHFFRLDLIWLIPTCYWILSRSICIFLLSFQLLQFSLATSPAKVINILLPPASSFKSFTKILSKNKLHTDTLNSSFPKDNELLVLVNRSFCFPSISIWLSLLFYFKKHADRIRTNQEIAVSASPEVTLSTTPSD